MNSKTQIYFNYIFLVVSSIMLVNLIVSIKRGIDTNRLTKLENDIYQLNEKKLKLEKELEYVKSDEFVIEEGKKRLLKGKPGEKLIIKKSNNNIPKETQKFVNNPPIKEYRKNYTELWINSFNLGVIMIK